ncbi:MAG: hypothetical protein D6711_13785 [Chloroflexi bacterium]|nr:MAG: hypothetical protein D6711_13785 [Chloroflexota bacterium]
MGYNTIADAEVSQDGPAAASTAQKFRDNLIAAFAADDTDETAPRLEPGALRNPVASTAVTIAKQVQSSTTLTEGSAGTDYTFALFIVVAPGVYTLTGDWTAYTSASGIVKIKKNGTAVFNSSATTGTFNNAITCSNGDVLEITYRVNGGGSGSTFSNIELKADYAAPLAQATFLTS